MSNYVEVLWVMIAYSMVCTIWEGTITLKMVSECGLTIGIDLPDYTAT
jgi:hypothetical protein